MANKLGLKDKLLKQLDEDRKTILSLYTDIKSQITDKNDYALHGLTLTKILEVLTKQSNHMLDLVKVEERVDPQSEVLSESEVEEVYKISSDTQKKLQ